MNASDLQCELERLHAASFGWALCCCHRRREEAEDVLQTVYVKVLEGKARFDGRSSLQTWLFGVIRRTASERRRRLWLRNALFERWIVREPSSPPPPDPEEMARGSEEGRVLRRALADLPGRQQQVLHLVFYQDLTIEEAARVLGVSLGTARTHFERGKHGLRHALSREAAR